MNKQSNFSNFPPQQSFNDYVPNDSRHKNNYSKEHYHEKRELNTTKVRDGDNKYYNYRSSNNYINSSSNYPKQHNNNYNNYNRDTDRASYSKSRHESYRDNYSVKNEEFKMDWICPVETCRNRNFAKREKCNLCRTPKPVNPEYDSSEFPKKRRKDMSRSKSRSRSRSGKKDVRDKDHRDRERKERDKDKERERERERDRERDRDRDKK